MTNVIMFLQTWHMEEFLSTWKRQQLVGRVEPFIKGCFVQNGKIQQIKVVFVDYTSSESDEGVAWGNNRGHFVTKITQLFFNVKY